MSTVFPIVNLASGNRLPCPSIYPNRPSKIHNWVTTSPSTNNRIFTTVDSLQKLRWVDAIIKVTTPFLKIIVTFDMFALLPYMYLFWKVVGNR